jgi:hypothetical protein
MPVIDIVDVIVLAPVALLCVYGIGRRIAGRLFGYWAAALFVAVPFIGVVYTNAGYHAKYTEQTLPQALGLSAMADFPSLVAVLVAAYLCVRTLDTHDRLTAVAAGLAAGVAIGIKPANAAFLVGPALAFAYARRWRAAAAVIVGLLPSLLVLAVWKDRGVGYLPLLSSGAPAHRFASSAAGIAGVPPVASIGRYLPFDWHHFQQNLDQIQESFWSLRLLEFLPIAGALGLLRVNRRLGVFVAGWFGAFVLVKGTYPQASIQDASLLRLLMPAAPAFVLLLASIPLLWPGLRVRAAEPARPLRRTRTTWAVLGATAVVFVLWPLAASAALSHGSGDQFANPGNLFLPLDRGLSVHATAQAGGTVKLTWNARPVSGSRVFYRVFRTANGDGIVPNPRGRSWPLPTLVMDDLGATTTTSFVDRPGAGSWTYRVAVATNWLDDPAFGDPYTISPPAGPVRRG